MKIDEKIIEKLNTLFFKLDTRGVFLDLNSACQNIFGYAKEEMTGKNFGDYISEKDQAEYKLFFNDTIKNSKKQYRQELEIVAQNGEKKILGFNLLPIEDEQNNLTGLFGFGADITGRRKTENNLAKKMRELEIFYKVSIEREIKMVELKKKINELEIKLGNKS